MNRESRPVGFRIFVLAVCGVILLSATGALARYWLISGPVRSDAGHPGIEHAPAGHARTEHDLLDLNLWPFADSATGLFDVDPTSQDDVVCATDRDPTETMLQDWTPDHVEDEEDWLMALATLMGLADGLNDNAAGPWHSCQM